MRRGIASALAIALLSCLTGCEDERLRALEAEVAQLEKARVPREAVEEAKRELARAETDREASREALRRAEERERALTADLAEQGEVIDREAAHQSGSEEGLVAIRNEEAALRERAATLRRALAGRLEEARTLCERVVEVEGQLRDGDPDWAIERRREVVEELVRSAAERRPSDPVLAALAASLAAPDAGDALPSRNQTEWARALAAKLRARLVAVYGEPRGGDVRRAGSADEGASGAKVAPVERRCPIVVPRSDGAPPSGA
ncbi:MAG: hypothetical protein U0900_17825 [Myxococcota bacterium]